MENANNWLIIPEHLYDYRIDNSSMTRTFDKDYFQEIIRVEEFVYNKMKLYLTDGKSYCDWAESVLAKYIDYIVRLQQYGVCKEEMKMILKKYHHSEIIRNAFYYAKKYSTLKGRIKAQILELGLYDLLRWHYR